MIWIHVSELAVDRLIAGEISGADAAAMRDHAASCARCAERIADAVATQRAFADNRPPLALPAPVVRRKTAIAVSVSSAIAAIAASLAVVLAWPHHAGAPGVRTKGAAIVGFYVDHGGGVRRGAVRETVVPGDRIELFTTTTSPSWFAAISDDATVYVAPQRIEPGAERVLPTAIELDGTLGVETVTGVFCATAFDPRAIPDGCTVDHFTLVKISK